MYNTEIDFDIQADELTEPTYWEDIQDDNPIDSDFEPFDGTDDDYYGERFDAAYHEHDTWEHGENDPEQC